MHHTQLKRMLCMTVAAAMIGSTLPVHAEGPETDSMTTMEAESRMLSESYVYDTLEIDPENGASSDVLPDEVQDIVDQTAGSPDEMKEALELASYEVEDSGDTLSVSSPYQLKSLLVASDTVPQDPGAEEAVYLEDLGMYMLRYGTCAETEEAYERLSESYTVDVDMPVTIESSSAPVISQNSAAYTAVGTSDTGYLEKSSDTAIVAVLDTGFSCPSGYEDTLFSGRVLTEYNATGDTAEVGDVGTVINNAHGTAVASIIADTTPSNVKIMPVRVFALTNDGTSISGTTSMLMSGFKYAYENGADVINMSLCCVVSDPSKLSSFNSLINTAHEDGVVSVAAAGNYASDIDSIPGSTVKHVYPACLDAVDTITAMTISGADVTGSGVSVSGSFDSSFSDYGSAVDFCMPGGNIHFPGVDGTTLTGNGTSYAAPFASAVFASLHLKDMDMSADQLEEEAKEHCIDLGDSGWDIYYGNGLISLAGTAPEEKKELGEIKMETDQFIYTGQPVTPSLTVTDSGTGTVLVQGTDYELAYENNIDAGTGQILVTGIGEYASGETKTVPFTISKADISKVEVTASGVERGSRPAVAVMFNGAELAEGTDYDAAWTYGTEAVVLRLTGKGNFTGSRAWTFEYPSGDIASASVILPYAYTDYTGSRITPVPEVKLAGSKLEAGTDYTVSYSNNVDAGTATVTVKGIGNCSGTVKKTFMIRRRSMTDVTVSGSVTVAYGGTPEYTLKLGTTILKEGTDFTVSRTDRTGYIRMYFNGTGNFKGTLTHSFIIKRTSISNLTVSLEYTSVQYTGRSLKPSVSLFEGDKKLTQGTDYNVYYSSNTEPGTATVTISGTGSYKGTVTKTFTIKAVDISRASIVLSRTSYTYAGSACTPAVYVFADGRRISGSCYSVTYVNNDRPGTATAVIKGTGGCTGTKMLNFEIR